MSLQDKRLRIRIIIGSISLVTLALALFGPSTNASTSRAVPHGLAKKVNEFHTNLSNNEPEKNGALVADDITVNVYAGQEATLQGRDQFVAWIKGLKQTFNDLKIEDKEYVVSGNTVAVRFNVTGTQTGPMPSPSGVLPASGKHVNFNVAEFFTFDSKGKLVHLEAVEDAFSMVIQLTH